MNKKEILKEIFEIEGISSRITQCPLITEEHLLNVLSKTVYATTTDFACSTATMTRYFKKLFPDRPVRSTKVDNWLLYKYGYKQCKNCEEVRLLEEFDANKAREDGVNSHCKTCVLETRRDYQREYQKRRKAVKLDRVPSWADVEKIKEIYRKCPEGCHVDHIIPLQGRLVSGLHVEGNLQYLSAKENLQKNNKFEV
jgi:hypothetical protein